MKTKILLLIITFVLLSSLVSATYTISEKDKTELSKYYKLEDVSGKLKLTTLKGVNVGLLDGNIVMKDGIAFVKKGRLERWDDVHYLIVKENFKIESNKIVVDYNKAETDYIDINDYWVVCTDKDCKLTFDINTSKIEVLGKARFTNALQNLDKKVKDTRVKRRTNTKMTRIFVPLNDVRLEIPNSKDHIINVESLNFSGTFKSSFGFKFIADKLEIKIDYNDKESLKRKIVVKSEGAIFIANEKHSMTTTDENGKDWLIATQALAFEPKNGLYIVPKSMLGQKEQLSFLYGKDSKYTLLYSQTDLDYFLANSFVDDSVVGIYFDENENVLRLYSKRSAKSSITVYPIKEGMKVISDELNVGSQVTIAKTLGVVDGNKKLEVKRDSFELKQTKDWKEFGIGFSFFIYNNDAKKFQRIECDYQTKVCKLDDKIIYDPVKKLVCLTDSDCDSGKTCVDKRCVVSKKCEVISVGPNAKINMLFITTGYESKQEATNAVNNLLNNQHGFFAFDPVKSYKQYFGIYHLDTSLPKYTEKGMEERFNVKEAKKSCSNVRYTIVLDKNGKPWTDYAPYSCITHVQIPMASTSAAQDMPPILVHEMGHNIAGLNDEYHNTGEDNSQILKDFYDGLRIRTVFPVNCVQCYKAPSTKGGWLSEPFFQSCGASCQSCRSWCRPSDNSVMNSKRNEVSFFAFNEPSKVQYEYVIRRQIGLPKNEVDTKAENWLKMAKDGVL
jgi:hypothetical protein